MKPENPVNQCNQCNYPHGQYEFSTGGEYFLCHRCGYQRLVQPTEPEATVTERQRLGTFVMVTSDRGIQNGVYNDLSFLDELDRNSDENPHIISVGYSFKDHEYENKFWWVEKNNSTKQVTKIDWTTDMFLVNGKLIKQTGE